ncbi:hypothetical protein DOJK_00168 [Patescibacteria group bacterium]|nr:hypothetical protein DOJK_00168 [Patescibacteria group bacterium]
MALQSMQLDKDTVIWLETSDETIAMETLNAEPQQGRGSRALMPNQVQQQLSSMQDTIKAFTTYTLNAFRQVTHANVNKVTLEFGVNVGGKAGIPYITEGSIGSNIKVTVECTFPSQTNS